MLRRHYYAITPLRDAIISPLLDYFRRDTCRGQLFMPPSRRRRFRLRPSLIYFDVFITPLRRYYAYLLIFILPFSFSRFVCYDSSATAR